MTEDSSLHGLIESGDIVSRVDDDPITVLHVDDEPDFADVAASFLERANDALDVVTETSADAALERLAGDATHVECVVSDYQMPVTNGIELLEAVREDHPELPFILFTGKGSEEVAAEAISAGVTDYLQKETGTDQYAILANRVTNAVTKRRMERNVGQLLQAMDVVEEGISLLDEDGRFICVNQAYADVYGYDREDLVGEHWAVLYPDDAVDEVRTQLLPSVPEDGVWEGQTTHVRADGTAVLVDHTLAYTDSGFLVCNSSPASAPRADDAPSLEALDALDDLLFVFDEDGTLQYWNASVETVTGYGSDQLATATPVDLVRDEDRHRMTRYVDQTRATGEARIEAELSLADGSTIPYEFISKRVTGDDGDAVARIGLGRDISERREYEAQIERQNERLEHFAEMLSHDLRNPLTVAKGNLELLHETGADDHYENASNALNRMESLVTDVLTLAQSGDLIQESENEPVELVDVAQSAWRLMQRDAATLTVEESTAFSADASRLQQILENLFRNAIEHGGRDVTVRVGLLPDYRGFYVADDGPGIPDADREDLFQPGFTTKQDGTGFGLATVKQLVDAHGWTVEIADSDEGGARFEVTVTESA